MQHGNLLNNLLSLNSAVTQGKAVAKNHQAAVHVTDERQDFQVVMAQTRSEVAEPKQAPKPRDNRIHDKVQQHKPAPEKTAEEPASKRQNPSSRTEKSPPQQKQLSQSKLQPEEKLQSQDSQSVLTDEKSLAGQSDSDITDQPSDDESVTTSGIVVDTLLSGLEATLLLKSPGGENLDAEGELSLELLPGQGLKETSAIDPLANELADVTQIPEGGKTHSPLVLATEDTLVVDSPLVNFSAEVLAAANKKLSDTTGTVSLQVEDNGEATDLVVPGTYSQHSRLQDVAPVQGMAGRSSTALDISITNQMSQDTELPDNLLIPETDTSTTELDLKAFDSTSGQKQSLLKTGENLLVPQEKIVTAEVAKPVAPTTPTSFVDALGRPLDNSLASTRSFTAQINLPQTMGNPQWNQAVGERVLWMAAQNLTAADIRLDPPELGSMHVKVTVQQDQASVTFVSPHPIVREALDQQATRLREMFAEQGLHLIHVDVSDRHAQERQSSGDEESSSHTNKQDEEEGLQVLGQCQVASLRLIDHYA